MKEKELKFLYESEVKKQVEEKVTVTEEQNGEKVEITRTIKKTKPVKVAILKPNRKLFEGAEKFYAIQIADFIRSGLLPYSLVAKRYANDGGPLSDPEKKHLQELKEKGKELETKYFEIVAEQDEAKIKERNELLVKINDVNAEIGNIQNAYSDIFENTAEVKARNKTIEWWVLNLAYINEDSSGYKPIFGEGDHETKLTKYDEIDEADDAFTNECIRKLSYLISFWFAAKSTLSKIDFESMDKLFSESLSNYKVEEDKTDIKIEEVKS
jgi:hypothetical protein